MAKVELVLHTSDMRISLLRDLVEFTFSNIPDSGIENFITSAYYCKDSRKIGESNVKCKVILVFFMLQVETAAQTQD